MAGEIPLHEIFLYDHWPGKPNPNLGIPAGGWDSSIHSCCQSIPTYPPGTKISAYSDFSYCPGNYVMCYLMFKESSDFAHDLEAVSEGYAICGDTGPDGADGLALLSSCYGTGIDYSESQWWIVTNSHVASDVSDYGRVAIGVHDMSEGEFGWFWIGGVCPAADVTWYDENDDLAGTTLSGAGDISAGCDLMPVIDATPANAICVGSSGILDWTWEFLPCGQALEADN